MSDGGNRQIAKNTIYMYARFLVTTLVGLYMSRLILLILGISDYGLYSVVGGILALFTFLSGSLSMSSSRFLNYEMGKHNGDVNRVFNINIILHFSLALIIFIIGQTVGLFYIFHHLVVEEGRLWDAVFVFEVAIIVSCLGINNTPYQSLFAAHENFKFLTVLDITNVLIRLGLIVLLQYYDGNALRMFAIIQGLTTLNNFIIFRLVANKRWPHIVRIKIVRGWIYYKNVLSFGWWNFLSSLSIMARSSGSDILINVFFGTSVNGAYAIGRTISDYASQLSTHFNSASTPQITQSYSANNISRCNYLVDKLGRFSLLLFALVFFPLYIELDFILHLWLKEVPDGVLLLAKMNLVLMYVSITSSGLETYISATGKIAWFRVVLSVFFLLCLPAGYYLLKYGAPYYTMILLFIIADILNRIVELIMVKYILGYNIGRYMKNVYLRPFAVVGIMSLIIYLYNTNGGAEDALGKLAAIFLTFLLAIFTSLIIGLEKNERKKLLSYCTKQLSRF